MGKKSDWGEADQPAEGGIVEGEQDDLSQDRPNTGQGRSGGRSGGFEPEEEPSRPVPAPSDRTRG